MCSRPLQSFNGHIGYCTQHKWVSPTGLGFDAEAATRNAQDAEELEKRRLEAERLKAERLAQEQREQHQRAIRKVVVLLIALCAVAAAIVFFVVRPGINYGEAGKQFAVGAYETARDGYSALGAYKDSAARALLCDAMLDLRDGRAEDAADKLNQLTADGQGDVAKQLADALLPVVADWRAKGLTPQALLLLLGKADALDPEGTLDVAQLKLEAHTALLDEAPLSTYAEDLNGDGQAELIALDSAYAVSVYRMADDGNVRMAVDNETAAACAATFGKRYQAADIDAAVACFAEAYRLLPGDEGRALLAAAYRRRASDRENAGEMEQALADARSALDTAGTEENFTFLYDMSLRGCRNGHSSDTAIALWDAFATDAAAELSRFSAGDRWQADAAQLHVAYAAELSAAKDERCIDELRTAAALGADVTDAMKDAQSHFEPGLALARLRLLELSLLGDDASAAKQARDAMNGEVRKAIGEWKTLGVPAPDVPALIHFADEQGVELDGIDRDARYREAAVAAAGSVVQYDFVNWDSDRYEELLTLDTEGVLCLYGMDQAWTVVSSVDTHLPRCGYTIQDAAAPLILVLSDAKDELLALAKQTTVTLRFSFRQTTSMSNAFVLTVEQNGKTQWTANIKGDSGGIAPQLQFPAGEYYLRVKPSTWLGMPYTLCLED